MASLLSKPGSIPKRALFGGMLSPFTNRFLEGSWWPPKCIEASIVHYQTQIGRQCNAFWELGRITSMIVFTLFNKCRKKGVAHL